MNAKRNEGKWARMKAQKENYYGFIFGFVGGFVIVIVFVPRLVGHSDDAYALVATGVGLAALVGAGFRCLAHLNAGSEKHEAAWKGVDMAGKAMALAVAVQILFLGLDQLGVI